MLVIIGKNLLRNEKTLCFVDRLCFKETQNVHKALQAVAPHEQSYLLSCNVMPDGRLMHRSKSLQMHLSEAQGCYLEAEVKSGNIQNLDHVHGYWDHVTAVMCG